ncbi:hypothetical protein Kpol_479p14 [Vanderwaltozyma polyspora DSM 70294]|uniref:Meiosis protein 5 n=1 Tax=Vanderwaltozyma polyspora (strain ATCC 22028 / DSM 70294 / BCRC 21397 / CBS 2163 / NBRC 10782 / NRRL Y-8283 / UCD 57-17) TaxID=436907 RepID=A7TQC7_VANPO|nr:uncharacterized protein Kpol_479p14 [Vanderwaltozyma polyspora DSM 70294]EDO15526.1 hypothetical protein Kpol_479p14 [Vanderwaltozyma polyspora DSM 70294]
MDDTTLINSSPNGKADPKVKVNDPDKRPLLTDLGKSSINKGFNKVNANDSSKELRILNNELSKELAEVSKKIDQLKQSIKILNRYEEQDKNLKLIEKWRGVSKAGMSYIFNSLRFRIDKMGGYEEFRRKEIEAEKRKIEYQFDDGLQNEIDNILDSEEFKALPIDDQIEYKEKMDEKIQQAEEYKLKQFEKFDKELANASNKELTMEELADRLKVEYKLIFSS